MNQIEHSFENAAKAILYFTSINDFTDSQNLFCKQCVDYNMTSKCCKKYYCDKIHKDDPNQKLIKKVVCTLRHWDSLDDKVEEKLCLTKCKYDKKCKKGSKCTFLHTADTVQSMALYLRYNFNCSFKYDLIWF